MNEHQDELDDHGTSGDSLPRPDDVEHGLSAILPKRSRTQTPPSRLTIDPFIGYRLWRVSPGTVLGDRWDRPVLSSAIFIHHWDGPVETAVCTALKRFAGQPDRSAHRGEQAPVPWCRCGVYAMKTPMTPSRPWIWAHGKVRLWGKVLEGDKGYRASQAQVIGPLGLWAGFGPTSTCLVPGCPHPATAVRVTQSLYIPRCEPHAVTGSEGNRMITMDALRDLTRTAFGDRYGVELEETNGHR